MRECYEAIGGNYEEKMFNVMFLHIKHLYKNKEISAMIKSDDG